MKFFSLKNTDHSPDYTMCYLHFFLIRFNLSKFFNMFNTNETIYSSHVPSNKFYVNKSFHGIKRKLCIKAA